MPYARPTLSELRDQAAQDIESSINGVDAQLRFSNLKITGDVQAGFSNLHYGYLDYIAKQSVPFTAQDEALEGWAALKGVYRKPATQATGYIAFSGVTGKIVPANLPILRGDGVAFTSTAAAEVDSSGTCIVAAIANADATGLTGAFGNTGTGVKMTLGQSIDGISATGSVSTAFTGGADIESNDDFRSRMLLKYQSPPQGGAESDYVEWALEVPGVTRAWAARNGYGAGTVVLYVMLDSVRASGNGFPQGTNGVASSETRAPAAAGDQLLVANALYDLQPATALLYVVSPAQQLFDFSIKGIPLASQSLIPGALAGILADDASPGGLVPLAHIWTAISAVSGVNDFVILSPTTDLQCVAGALPVVGSIVYS